MVKGLFKSNAPIPSKYKSVVYMKNKGSREKSPLALIGLWRLFNFKILLYGLCIKILIG
jgi:hypothetical protein